MATTSSEYILRARFRLSICHPQQAARRVVARPVGPYHGWAGACDDDSIESRKLSKQGTSGDFKLGDRARVLSSWLSKRDPELDRVVTSTCSLY